MIPSMSPTTFSAAPALNKKLENALNLNEPLSRLSSSLTSRADDSGADAFDPRPVGRMTAMAEVSRLEKAAATGYSTKRSVIDVGTSKLPASAQDPTSLDERARVMAKRPRVEAFDPTRARGTSRGGPRDEDDLTSSMASSARSSFDGEAEDASGVKSSYANSTRIANETHGAPSSRRAGAGPAGVPGPTAAAATASRSKRHKTHVTTRASDSPEASAAESANLGEAASNKSSAFPNIGFIGMKRGTFDAGVESVTEGNHAGEPWAAQEQSDLQQHVRRNSKEDLGAAAAIEAGKNEKTTPGGRGSFQPIHSTPLGGGDPPPSASSSSPNRPPLQNTPSLAPLPAAPLAIAAASSSGGMDSSAVFGVRACVRDAAAKNPSGVGAHFMSLSSMPAAAAQGSNFSQFQASSHSPMMAGAEADAGFLASGRRFFPAPAQQLQPHGVPVPMFWGPGFAPHFQSQATHAFMGPYSGSHYVGNPALQPNYMPNQTMMGGGPTMMMQSYGGGFPVLDPNTHGTFAYAPPNESLAVRVDPEAGNPGLIMNAALNKDVSFVETGLSQDWRIKSSERVHPNKHSPQYQEGPLSEAKTLGTGTSIYRGVFWDSSSRAYRAKLKIKGRTWYLGIYQKQLDAAKAYDSAARYVLGSNAILNFKSETPELVRSPPPWVVEWARQFAEGRAVRGVLRTPDRATAAVRQTAAIRSVVAGKVGAAAIKSNLSNNLGSSEEPEMDDSKSSMV